MPEKKEKERRKALYFPHCVAAHVGCSSACFLKNRCKNSASPSSPLKFWLRQGFVSLYLAAANNCIGSASFHDKFSLCKQNVIDSLPLFCLGNLQMMSTYRSGVLAQKQSRQYCVSVRVRGGDVPITPMLRTS